MAILRRTNILYAIGFAAIACLAAILYPRYWETLRISNMSDHGDEHDIAIGIELGRTYSRAGIFRNDKFEIFADENGHTEIPSYVAFTEHQKAPLVGSLAMDESISNEKNTIYDTRILLGLKSNGHQLWRVKKNLPYEIIEQKDKPSIKVHVMGEDQYYTAEEITSKIFEKLKSMAEVHLGRKVRDAVITVPSHFKDDQRQAVKNAAEMAGLVALRLVNEPTAAGIAYGLDRQTTPCSVPKEKIYVVLNVGEKELEVAVESVDCGVFEIFSHLTDRNLGGHTGDDALVTHIDNHFHDKYGIKIYGDIETLRQLKSVIHKAEAELAIKSSASIDITIRQLAKHLSMTITKAELQERHKRFLELHLEVILDIIREAKIQKHEVDGIVLTGDPTYTARLHNYIEEHLGIKIVVSKDVLPAHAIVHGAAIQGQLLSSYMPDICTMGTLDVSRLSLGIETSPGNFTKIIPRNTVIPVRKSRVFTNAADNQEKVVIKILEGERALASKNRVLGTLELDGFPSTKKGGLDIEVVFEIDPNEVLTVFAREKKSGKEVKLVTPCPEDRYTGEEREAIIVDSEINYEADNQLLKQASIELCDETKEPGFGVIAK